MGYLFYRCFTTKGSIGQRYACFSEILLRQDICGNLAPSFGNFNIVHLKYDLSRRISDYRTTIIILELIKNIDVVASVTPVEKQTVRRLRMSGHKMEVLYVVRKIVSLLTNR